MTVWSIGSYHGFVNKATSAWCVSVKSYDTPFPGPPPHLSFFTWGETFPGFRREFGLWPFRSMQCGSAKGGQRSKKSERFHPPDGPTGSNGIRSYMYSRLLNNPSSRINNPSGELVYQFVYQCIPIFSLSNFYLFYSFFFMIHTY